MTETPVTPADLAALADRIEILRGELALATNRLRHGSEDARTIGYRLDDQVGGLKHVVDELTGAAADLTHISTARLPGRCRVEWGACPEHGATLRYEPSRGLTGCVRPGCTRTWERDASVLPCGEPVTHTVTDMEGGKVEFCAGHALDARERLIGATITPLTASQA